MKINYHSRFANRIIVEQMFDFNERIVALECDQDSQLLDIKNQATKECIYVLLEDGKLKKLVTKDEQLRG